VSGFCLKPSEHFVCFNEDYSIMNDVGE
jgi:hypothetical protein